jgi:hypothetical protein
MALGYLVLATLTALAAVAALAVAMRTEPEGRAELGVTTTIVWNALIVVPIYVLGLTNHLSAKTIGPLVTFECVVVLFAAYTGVDRRAFTRRLCDGAISLARLPYDAIRDAARARSPVVLGEILALLTIVWTVVMSWCCASWGQWDALWYHEPMIGFAIQNHGFAMVDLPMDLQKINGYPRVCEMTQLWFVVFTDRRLIDVVNSLISPALMLSVYVLAKRFTRDRVVAAGWAVALFLPPMCTNLLATIYVDVHNAMFILAGLCFATRPQLRVRDGLLATLCLSLAIGSKSMALVPVGIIAPMALVRLIAQQGRARKRDVTFTGLAGVLAIGGTAAITYWRNWKHFHNPLWPDVKIDVPKYGIHWPGLVPWGNSSSNLPPHLRIDMNIPMSQLFGDLYSIPYAKSGSYLYQDYDYGFAVSWCVLPFAAIALASIVVALLASFVFRFTGWSSWRAKPETFNALLVALPALFILKMTPALWAARYNIVAVAVLMVLVAWLGGRRRFARLGHAAVVFSVLGAIATFFWVKPRWIYTPTELKNLARIPYPEREVTPVRDVAADDVYLARGSAITRDVGLAREIEIGPGDLVAFDDTYGGFPALFWNNHYTNRVVYLPNVSTFVADAEKMGAKWIYCSYSDGNLGRLRAKGSGWEEVGMLNVEGWGSMFRRAP